MRWSLCSPHSRIRRRPPAKIAKAMTILAQLFRASSFWNLVFKLLDRCLVFVFHGPASGCGQATYLWRHLNIRVQSPPAIAAGSLVRHMQWIRKLPSFYAGSSVFVLSRTYRIWPYRRCLLINFHNFVIFVEIRQSNSTKRKNDYQEAIAKIMQTLIKIWFINNYL